MKLLQYLGPIAIGAALIAASGDARAIDPSIRRAEVAATVCQKRGTGGTPVYTAFGTIYNDSTTTLLQVDCPIPFVVDTSYGDQLDVSAFITGNGSAFNCTIYVEKLSPTPASPTFYSAAATTSATGDQQLGFDINVFENSAYGVMHAACDIPRKSGSTVAVLRGFVTKD